MNKIPNPISGGRPRRQATRSLNLLWTDGVPYALDSKLSQDD